VLLGHTIYAGSSEQFSTVPQALITLLVFVRGDIDLIKIGDGARLSTPIFMAAYMFFVVIFLINGFVGVMVLAMMRVQIVEGDPWNTAEHRWDLAAWMKWLTGGMEHIGARFKRFFDKRKKGGEDEDDEGEYLGQAD